MDSISDSIEQPGGQSKHESTANLMRAVGEAAALLLAADDRENIDDILMSSLEIIGCAMDADRVHIWRDEQLPDEMILKYLYTWESEHGKAAAQVPPDIIAPFVSFPEWHGRFRKGECIGGPLSGMAPDEQEFFSTYGIKTVYLVPLSLGDTFWGVFSIDDCKRERSFTEEELIIFKSFSLMVANAINHHMMVVELIAINEKADAASKAKNAFLANMSHEVRTPLNAIVGMALVGRNSTNIGEKNHALDQIGDASAHLLEIISNVLDMARIEDDKLELVPVDYIFRDMVDKVVASMKHLAKDKNQVLTVHVDDAIPRHAIGDDKRMIQLLSNVISNAVKFTPIYGRITMDLTLLSETETHFELEILVKDNGIGITEDQKDILFMPFGVSHGALNRDYGGTGLGLPISKRIVELMDGSITVESEPNRGTTVCMKIVLAKSTADDAPADAADSMDDDDNLNGSLVTPGEFKGKRLLIVEDIEINREILIALLRGSELIIDCAEDGQIAVDMIMFNVDKYDIVFMDLQMPNLGGLDATRMIRELPERKRGRLPIVAMTANVMSDDIKACMEAGMDGHLGKPLDIDKVLAVLRQYLTDNN